MYKNVTPIYRDKHMQKRLVELRNKGWEVMQVCRRLGFSKSTYYRVLRAHLRVS